MTGPKPAQIKTPKQNRSRRTLERIVDASLELLATEGAEGLTIHRVVEKAGSSVGSFYARFKGKDDLLDYLAERVWTQALERWHADLAAPDWDEMDLTRTVETAVTLVIEAQRSRSAYLEVLDQANSSRAPAYEQFRTERLARLAEILMKRRDDIVRDDAQQAVRLGLRAVVGVVDEERRSSDRLPQDVLVRECTALLAGYLGGAGSGESDSGVEFFDVWG